MRKMKKSSIPWIDCVPDSWHLAPLYSMIEQVKNSNKGMKCNNLLSLSYGKIKKKDIETNEGLLPASFETYNIIDDGDIVLRLTDLQNDKKSLRVGLCKERGIITSAYVTIRPISIIPDFLYYVLHTYDLQKVFYDLGTGLREGMKYEDVKRLMVYYPSLSEQKAISLYLDSKCSQIDEAIRRQESIIGKLKEYRQSVITEAVTKGLDPNVEMKDSGIDWIGFIPSSWQIKRLKHIASVTTGDSDTQDSEPDGVYPFYVRSPIVEKSNHVSFSGEAVLMAGDGVGAGRVFHFAAGKYAVHQRVYRISDFPDTVATRFVYYYLCSMFPERVRMGTAKSTVDSIRLPMIKEFNIAIPPLCNQRTIVSYLDFKCSQIDEAIRRQESIIDKLKAYRQSLIYEVVTGKREVV